MITPVPEVSPFIISEIRLDKNDQLFSVDYESNPQKPGSKKAVTINSLPSKEEIIKACKVAVTTKSAGIKVKELKYYDLVADYNHCNGIYLFCSDSPQGCISDSDGSPSTSFAVMYVGKTTSRAVVDRVGSHLDLRVTGFLNCLVKRIAEDKIKSNKVPVNDCVINGILSDGQVKDLIGEWRFIFIPVFNNSCQTSKEYAKKVAKLESYLIRKIGPKHNMGKSKNNNKTIATL